PGCRIGVVPAAARRRWAARGAAGGGAVCTAAAAAQIALSRRVRECLRPGAGAATARAAGPPRAGAPPTCYLCRAAGIDGAGAARPPGRDDLDLLPACLPDGHLATRP